MKTKLIVLTLFSVLIHGCAPDLQVAQVTANWNDTQKEVTARVANAGNKDAGPFYIYFNAEDPDAASISPPVNEIREQKSFEIPSLEAGRTVERTATFDTNKVQTVKTVSILVDPKHMVDESREDNNVGGVLLARAPKRGEFVTWQRSTETCFEACERKRTECALEIFKANPPPIQMPGQPNRAPGKIELPYCWPEACEPEEPSPGIPDTSVCNDELRKCNLVCLLRFHYFYRPDYKVIKKPLIPDAP